MAVTCKVLPLFPDGSKAGLHFSEAYQPWKVFKAAGFDVVAVSEDGTVGFDEHSISAGSLNEEESEAFEDHNSEFNKLIKETQVAGQLDPTEFGLFYAAGGHGAAFDFEKAADLQALAANVWVRGGPVGAVCHGPMIFNGIKDPKTGEHIVKDRQVTGFPTEGEKSLQLLDILRERGTRTVEESLSEVGARWYAPPEPKQEFMIADGRIVTGANPASAVPTAQKLVSLFQTMTM